MLGLIDVQERSKRSCDCQHRHQHHVRLEHVVDDRDERGPICENRGHEGVDDQRTHDVRAPVKRPVLEKLVVPRGSSALGKRGREAEQDLADDEIDKPGQRQHGAQQNERSRRFERRLFQPC